MNDKRKLVGFRMFDPGEKLTRQVKVSMPINYLREVDSIAKDLRMPKRFIYWGAVANYIDVCRRGGKRGQGN